MGKALLIAAVAVCVLGQSEEGVVTSTDLIAPDVSASERDGQQPAQQPERATPRETQEEAPDAVAEPDPGASGEKALPEEESVEVKEEPPAPREVTSDEARRHKAVAAFWFILPET